MSQTTSKLTRAREAFVYSVRRRALRFARLEGCDEEQARHALQLALSRFLPLTRQAAPQTWTGSWWRLLMEALPGRATAPAFGSAATRAWQRDWDALPLPERRAFLLQVWLRLPLAEAAAAEGISAGEITRRMARASLQLRHAEDLDRDESERLREICDALERAPLADIAPPLVLTPKVQASRRAWRRPLLAVCGVSCLALGGWLSWPRPEAVPPELAVHEGAAGLMPSTARPTVLPEDAARIVDPDWPLWAEPDQAEVIKDLEFYAWLEAQDAR